MSFCRRFTFSSKSAGSMLAPWIKRLTKGGPQDRAPDVKISLFQHGFLLTADDTLIRGAVRPQLRRPSHLTADINH
ncbi:hypothetical protein EYF80_022610 [Liparis tanakae]|uniref:Uncharacterized protein n=1 Tax=Liparis tanakae TaxID=230148 RepID=A0A4Z2HQA2_9TELE|nr:hypothetical protein EYF80_022610 [Liparis tanakae]